MFSLLTRLLAWVCNQGRWILMIGQVFHLDKQTSIRENPKYRPRLQAGAGPTCAGAGGKPIGYSMYMDSNRLLGLLLAAVLVLSGCSSTDSQRSELRTPTQASRFVASIARGGAIDAWRLAPGASGRATRAWEQRRAIADLGFRLRHEGGRWGCELAISSYGISQVGVFSIGDRQSIGAGARLLGAKEAQVKALFLDIEKTSRANLRAAINAVCPYAYLE